MLAVTLRVKYYISARNTYHIAVHRVKLIESFDSNILLWYHISFNVERRIKPFNAIRRIKLIELANPIICNLGIVLVIAHVFE